MEQKIKQLILNLLARRDHATQEIIVKLQRKGYPKSAIEAVLTALKPYFDDQRYAANYVRRRQAKGIGPLKIKLELRQKGIPEKVIAEAVKIIDNAWLIAAKRLWSKHYKPDFDWQAKSKLARFLQNRGFSEEHIQLILRDEDAKFDSFNNN